MAGTQSPMSGVPMRRSKGEKSPGNRLKYNRRSLCLADAMLFDSVVGHVTVKEPREVNDLTTLTKLDDPILCDMLHKRYNENMIYTYVGDILVAVNPFQTIKGLYGPERQQQYQKANRKNVSPHVYATADAAYTEMYASGMTTSQCCIVSGESGAGKTESAKLIMEQVMMLCGEKDSGEASAILRRKIIAVNPLLEAFGNAQTTKNDNSSRFGKYTELLFNKEGKVLGSDIAIYLLEKSRVTAQNPQEQNFHVFYYLFLASENGGKARDPTLGLIGSMDEYRYLPPGAETDVDLDRVFKEVAGAMQLVGFTPDEEKAIWGVLAAILLLGEIKFIGEAQDDAKLSPESTAVISRACKNLGIEDAHLVELLTGTWITAAGETVRRQYSRQQGEAACDAISRAIYGRLFSWIVVNVNQMLAWDKSAKRSGATIGILDIFGFENFTVNSFEQLCINLANEQLQFFFNEHVFELEQHEYRIEGIDLANITYADNKPLLEMHLKSDKKNPSFFNILDEESLLQKTNADTLCSKLRKHFLKHHSGCFSVDRGDQPYFFIEHYAGQVKYQADDFIEKNRDDLAHDVTKRLVNSTAPLVPELFVMEINAATGAAEVVSHRKESAAARGRRVAAAKEQVVTANKRPITIGTQFRVSLELLYKAMSDCTPHFVRCLKPNESCEPMRYEDPFVMRQLQYTGMLATTRIRREGFAVRIPFKEFVTRFKVLGSATRDPQVFDANACCRILEKASITGYETGTTKMFLKHFHLDELEARIWEIAMAARRIQRAWKVFNTRRKTKQFLAAAEASVLPVVERVKLQKVEDAERKNDLLRQIEEARIFAAERRRQEREAAAEAERKRMEEERAALEASCRESQEELLTLLAALKEKMERQEDVRDDLAALFQKLSVREKLVEEQFDHCRTKIARIRVDQVRNGKESEDSQAKRDEVVAKMAYQAERGGANAPKAIKAMRENLDELILECEAQVDRAATLERQLEKETGALEYMNSEETSTLFKVNRAIRECMGILHNEVDLKAAAMKKAESTATRQLRESEDAMAALRRQSEAAEAALAEQRALAEKEKAKADSVNAETQRSVAQLQSVNRDTERELAERTKELTSKQEALATAEAKIAEIEQAAKTERASLKESATAAASEHAAEVQKLQRAADNAKRTLNAEKSGLEDRLRELEDELARVKKQSAVKLNTLQATLDDKQLEVDELNAKLKQSKSQVRVELADREDALGDLETKYSAMVAQRASARSELTKVKSELEEAKLRVEEGNSEVARLKRTIQQRDQIIGSRSTDSGEANAELKEMLAQRDEVSKLRHKEHEAMVAKLEAVISQQRSDALAAQKASMGTEQELRQELRLKDRYVQGQIAEKDAVINDLNSRLVATKTELLAAQNTSTVAEDTVPSTELAMVTARLTEATALCQSIKDEAEETAAEYQRALRDRAQSEEDRLATERGIRLAVERAKDELQAKLDSAVSSLKKARLDHQRQSAETTKTYDAQIARLEGLVAERDQTIVELQSREAVLRERSIAMSKQIDETVAIYAVAKEERDRALDELEQVRIREERERERSMSMHQAAVSDLKNRLSLQTEAQRRNFVKLKEAIAAISRKPPGTTTPGEGAHVDLLNYMTIMNGEGGLPHNIRVDRFTCKSYLIKLAAQVEQRRWVVLDLQQKTLSWYIDNRELRISRKGQIPIRDIEKVVDPGQEPGSMQPRAFLLGIPKRTYTFVAESLELKECWMQVFRCMLGQG